MPVIDHKNLEGHLQKSPKANFPQVCLIHGEEYLRQKVLTRLLDTLLPISERDLNYDPLDGSEQNTFDAIERMNTLSFSPENKVVGFLDTRLFYTQTDTGELIAKARETFEQGDLKKAGRYLCSYLAKSALSLEEVQPSNLKEIFNLEAGDDAAWLERLIAFCRENHLSAKTGRDTTRALQSAIEKGFPRHSHLIITSDAAPLKHELYKTIEAHGLVIDCRVPTGQRKSDKEAQTEVLALSMKTVLDPHQKRMEPRGYALLCELTGFDPRGFVSNLEKLVDFVGERTRITPEDVQAVIRKTRQEPIYEFTNAVFDKNFQKSFLLLDSLLAEGLVPLQILAALVNQVRRLMVVKDFVHGENGRAWHGKMTYNQFQNQIIPAIREFDASLEAYLQQWQEQSPKADSPKSGKRRPSVKSGVKSDLFIAKNTRSAYPVYQMFLKSEKFTRQELRGILKTLEQADLQLKTSPQSPRIVLDSLLVRICRATPR